METKKLLHHPDHDATDPGAGRPGAGRRILGAAFLLGLPVIFWFLFFANPGRIPAEETARAPAGFVQWDVYRLY